jgi:hypothetical protein
MRWPKIALASSFTCVLLSLSAFAQCDIGAEVRIQAEKIEAKPIPSVIAVSSSGRRFLINSDSNQIDVVLSNSSSATVRDFAFRYAKCTVSVSIKEISLESELVMHLFPLVENVEFNRFVGLTVPKSDYSIEDLQRIVNGNKEITLRIK